MTYGELTAVAEELNTGSSLPNSTDVIIRMICSKIAQRQPSDLLKKASITTSGSTSLNLRTLLPDFFSFKLGVNNNDKIIYSLDSNNNPTYYKLGTPTVFADNTQGGFAKLEGRLLTISVRTGETTPSVLYFDYHSLYCWADYSTNNPILTPVNNDDYLLLNPSFEPVVIDGLLLYITRKEKDNKEYEKAVIEWEKSLINVILAN